MSLIGLIEHAPSTTTVSLTNRRPAKTGFSFGLADRKSLVYFMLHCEIKMQAAAHQGKMPIGPTHTDLLTSNDAPGKLRKPLFHIRLA